jgi:hypothetical protein
MMTKQKRKIEQLTRSGKRQAEIAFLLRIHRNSVYRAQRALGLTACQRPSPEVEAQIVPLLRSGLGTGKVCRRLNVTEHFVRLTARKNKFHRKPGYRSHLPRAKRRRIVDEIKNRRNFAVDIAAKYHASYKTVLRMAHSVLGCPVFRPGRGSPLISNFPQRHHGKGKA